MFENHAGVVLSHQIKRQPGVERLDTNEISHYVMFKMWNGSLYMALETYIDLSVTRMSIWRRRLLTLVVCMEALLLDVESLLVVPN